MLNSKDFTQFVAAQSRASWRLGLAVAAGGRGLDDHGFAGLDHGGVAALQPFHRAVLASRPILADLAGLAAGGAEWRHAAMAGEQGRFHPREEAHGAAHAVAGVPFAFAAGALADVEV